MVFSIQHQILLNGLCPIRSSSVCVLIDLLLSKNYFIGTHTSNFTATDQLLMNNLQINYWRFEVIYSFDSYTSTSALHFMVNQPPQNGSCWINPTNGTTTTIFTIYCSNWIDTDGIKDYLFYGIIYLTSEKELN